MSLTVPNEGDLLAEEFARHEAAKKIEQAERDAKREAEEKARVHEEAVKRGDLSF